MSNISPGLQDNSYGKLNAKYCSASFSLCFAHAYLEHNSKRINIFTSEVLFLLLYDKGKALGKTVEKATGTKGFPVPQELGAWAEQC